MERTEWMLYVGNISDVEKGFNLSHRSVAIATRKKGAAAGWTFLKLIRQCASSGPAAAGRATFLRFLSRFPTPSVSEHGSVAERVHRQDVTASLGSALLYALNVKAGSIVRTHSVLMRLRF